MQRNRLVMAAIAAGLLAVLAVGGLYVASPWMAIGALKSALQHKDRDKLEELVDFPSVRENLKADFNAMMMKKLNEDPDLKNNPFAGLAFALAPGLVDRMVDATVNPANLSNLGGRPAMGGDSSGRAGEKPASPGKVTSGYVTLDRFKVTQPIDQGRAIGWILKRKGLFAWRLTRIELPAGLFDTPESAINS